jgi:hypothetical protein
MSITNLTIPYSTPYQVSADDIDLIKIRSLETSPLTHEDLDDNFANLMNKVNALVDIIGGSSAAISVDGSGNVGIGTTNPTKPLHILSTVVDQIVLEANSTTVGPNMIFKNTDGNLARIRTDDSENLHFENGTVNTTRMTIDSDGNVGIGTTNPVSKLTISETGNAVNIDPEGSSATSYIGFRANVSAFVGYDYDNASAVLQSGAGKSLRLNTGNETFGSGTALTIDPNGNVGIGTTTPASNHKLHIKHTETANFRIERNKVGHTNSQNGYFQITAAEGSNLIYSKDLDGNAKNFVIDGGNVGIGTTNPSVNLDLKKASNDGGATLRLRSAAVLDDYKTVGSIEYFSDDASTDSTGLVGSIDVINAGTTWRGDGNNAAMTFNLIQGLAATTSPVEAMRIDSDGNVGIGTTNPSFKLHLNKSTGGGNSSSYTGGILIENTDTANTGECIIAFKNAGNAGTGANFWWSGLNQDNYFAIGYGTSVTNAVTKLAIDTSGNVGIGTTSPDEAFHIKGDDKRMFIGSDDYNLFSLGRRSSTELDTAYLSMMDEGDQKVVLDTSGDSYFNGGNVGIGTTNPQHKLDISTNDTTGLRLINPDSAEVNQSNDPPAILFQANGWELRDDGDGSRAYSARIRVSSNYSGESGRGNTHPVMNFDLETNENNPDDNLSTKMMINADGKVGIGTTSPSAKLEINSGTNDANLRLVSTDPYVDIKMSDNTTTDYGVRISNKGDDLLLQRAGGRVGIGTTSPSATLDIQGTAKLNGADLATVDQLGGGGIWAENTSGAYYNGNVGIGTTSPDHPLEIQASGSKYGCHILDDQGGSLGGLFISEQGAATDGLELYLKQPNGNTKIRLSSVDNNPTYFNSGRVGIGTTSPDSKLHLSTTGLDGLRLSVDSQSYYHMIRPNGDGLYIGADEDSSGGSGADIRLNIKGDEKMRIDSDGNVGIGTSSPSANLHVLKDMGSTNVDGSFTLQKTAYTRSSSHPEGSGQFMTHKLHELSYSGDFSTSGNNHLNDTIIGLDVNLDTNAGGQYAALFNGGKVGIGTSSPIFTLDVASDATLALGSNSSKTRADNTNKSSRVGGVRYNNANPVNMMMHVCDPTQNLLYFGWGTSSMVCPTKIVFGTAPSNNISSANSTGNQRMIIDGNGDVLIKNDLDVVGNLSKGSGTFKIDHPLPEKSETHHLVHSFIEGPKADNIYRGKVELVAGKAEVNIDAVSGMTEGTFVALNRDIQVFTSNENDWDAVRGKVEGNKLIIECQNTESTATISWLVIGERQDEHIRESKITDDNGKLIVEPLKPEPEPEYEEVEPEEVITEEPVAEEAPEPQAVEEPQPEPQEVAQVSLGQVSLGQVSVGQVSLSESPLDEIKEIRAEDGKEYIRIGDKDYEVLGKNEDGSLLLDDDVTNNG